MLEHRREHVFSYVVTLKNPPEVIRPVPGGIRANFYVVDGEVSGPRLRGRVRPVARDWFTERTDGVVILDVGATFESHDGALIEIAFTGVGDVGKDGYQRFLQQEVPLSVQLRVAARFRTAHPDYEWLNRVQFIGVGEINMEPLEVRFDIYAVR